MVVVDVILGILVLGLAVATVYMAIFGGMGALGIVRYRRCPDCGHLTLTSAVGRPDPCGHCRHLTLYHPLHTLHEAAVHRHLLHPVHGGARLPVARGDRVAK